MGVVYAAKYGELDRDVALKVISPYLADNRDFRVRFAREARAMTALESGNVVHVYTFGEDRGRLYIASQLIPDGDLDSVLRAQGGAPLGLALDLMAQVAAGLADAHLAGLVHRDIKPANVLLRQRPDGFDAYLGGFGAPPAGTALGAASDISTMGWLLWTTATGWPPYAGALPQLAGDSPQVQNVNRILRTALAADPKARYPSAAALRDDLRFAVTLPGPSWLVAAPAPLSRRRRGAALGLGAGLVAALVLGAGGAVWAGVAMRNHQPVEAARVSLTEPRPSAADERRAVSNIANAFGTQLFVGPAKAQCIAESWVDAVGIDSLAAAGFLDDDMFFYDQDLETVDPELEAALGDATAECLAG